MPLKVMTREGQTLFVHSPEDFERIFHVRYVQSIQFKEGIAKLVLEAKFDDFGAGSVSRKLTYPVGHRRFARNPNQHQKRKFGPKWSFAIPSKDNKIESIIQKRIKKALIKEWITPRQKWLGSYYAAGIKGQIPLDLTIGWINERIGYGLWTNRDIPSHAFIGQYTGLLRKRKFWKRWHNLYCFDYNIGEGRSSSYVIDAQDYGNYTRFINHSFTPNLEPVSVYYDEKIYVIIYAKKMIPEGTQLCYDYGDEYWEKRIKPEQLEGFSFR